MAGEAIDAIGEAIQFVGAPGIGTVVNVPCVVTALGALSNGIPVLTLLTKYANPTGSYVTLSTVYSTQTMINK